MEQYKNVQLRTPTEKFGNVEYEARQNQRYWLSDLAGFPCCQREIDETARMVIRRSGSDSFGRGVLPIPLANNYDFTLPTHPAILRNIPVGCFLHALCRLLTRLIFTGIKNDDTKFHDATLCHEFD